MYIDGLDELDNKILTVLEKNARLSYSEIGEKVGLSRVAVKNRVDILEQKGIIEGYYTKINPTNMEEGRRFFMEIVTEPDQFEQIATMIAKDDIIRRVYAVTGDCRIRVEGFASSKNKYEMYMRNLKSNLKGIKLITIQDLQYVIKDVERGIE